MSAFVVLHPEIIEIQPIEEGIVQEASDVVWRLQVQPGWFIEQVEVTTEDVCSLRQLVAAVCELVFRALPFSLQFAEPYPDAVGGQLAICEQVKQSLLLGVEPCDLSLHARVQLAERPLLVIHRSGNPDTQIGDELIWQLHGGVVLLDVLLDLPDGEMSQVAESFLASSADEVGVPLASMTGRLGVDQATGALLSVATVAEQHALQIMGVDAIPLAVLRAGGEYFLHVLE